MIKKTFFYFLLFFTFYILHFTFYLSHPVSAITTPSLSVNPPLVSKKENESFPLEVRLAVSEIVVGIDLDISFDPNLVEITKITPGSFFANPQILTNLIDNQKGEVKFSVFSYPGKSGADSIVNLQARLLGTEFTSTVIKIGKGSVISGQAGKKIETSFGQATVSPFKAGLLTPPLPWPTSVSQFPDEATPTPIIFSSQPTIFLADKITPAVKDSAEKSNFLGILASVFITLGAGILLLVVLFLRKFRSSVKE